MISTNSKYNVSKLIQVATYIIKEIDGATDMHKLFKVLYFAERDHLSKFGRMITDDKFVAMKYGPVPSMVFDIFKIIRGDSIYTDDYLSECFEVENYNIKSKIDFDEFDEISRSEKNSLDFAISTFRNYSFDELSDISHDDAWNATERDDIMLKKDIAKAGNIDEETFTYIQLLEDNKATI